MNKPSKTGCEISFVEVDGIPCEVSCEIGDIGEYGEPGTRLCLQKCVFRYESGIEELGYRFIRYLPNRKTNPCRGQACIPTLAMARKLIDMMEEKFGIDEQAEWPEGRYSRNSDSCE